MKKKIYGLMMAWLLAGGLASCQSELDGPQLPDGGKPGEIRVSAGGPELSGEVATRSVIGNTWTGTNEIGIIVESIGGDAVSNNLKNVKYTSTDGGSGKTSVNFSSTSGILLDNDKQWEFSAYYPYSSTGTIAVSNSDLSNANRQILHTGSTNAKAQWNPNNAQQQHLDVKFNGDGTDTWAGSKFEYQMAGLIIEIKHDSSLGSTYIGDFQVGGTNGAEYSMNLKTASNKFAVAGTYTASSNSFSSTDAQKANSLNLSSNGLKLTQEVNSSVYSLVSDKLYLIPQEFADDVVFTVKVNKGDYADTYSCTVSKSQLKLEKGKIARVTMTFSPQAGGGELKVTTVNYSNSSTWGGGSDMSASLTFKREINVGDIVFADGTMLDVTQYNNLGGFKSAFLGAHGNAIGIVALLYGKNGANITDGVKSALSGINVNIPTGLILALEEKAGAWTTDYSSGGLGTSKIGDGYESPALGYTRMPDGIGIMSINVGGTTILNEVSKGNGSFSAHYVLNALHDKQSSWIKEKTTNWYMPSYREWADMIVSWAYVIDFNNAGNLSNDLKSSGSNFSNFSTSQFSGKSILDYVNGIINAVDGQGLSQSFYMTATQSVTDNYVVSLKISNDGISTQLQNKIAGIPYRYVLAF